MKAVNPRDIEKLKAIGLIPASIWLKSSSEELGWMREKHYAQTPEGMKATMADKVLWLIEHCHDAALVELFRDTSPLGMPQPADAVDQLFWKVP